MNHIFRIATLTLTLVIASCGWHLRGHEGGLTQIESAHISARHSGSELVRMLKRNLSANKIVLLDNANDAQYSIVILKQRSDRKVATVSANARVSEYRLTEEVDMLILNANGEQVLGNTTLTTEKVFEFDEDNVHARDDEERLLKSEMYDSLVRQIVSRLRLVSSREAATTTNATES